MRLMFHSNAPHVASGYGVQTELFSRLALAEGHEVIVSAFYGLRGASLNMNGVLVLPGAMDGWGNDALPAHYQAHRPDAVVALMDIWVLEPPTLAAVPVTAWAPVDHDPLPPAVEAGLKKCKHVWAMSRFAEREMQRIGLEPYYVPHGVDTDVFAPGDRAEARRRWSVPEGIFFAVAVAANKGWPSRKSLDRLLKAWARFAETHPDSLLYLHTPADHPSAIDLSKVAAFYGVPPQTIRFGDEYRLALGAYNGAAMAALYNAADALVLPSAGGGFEIPLIEAQSCGCPVVTTKVTAMAELVGPGYGIEIDPFDGMAMTLQYSEQANVLPSQILAGLEWAFAHRGDGALRAASREFALGYDAARVWREHMLPALEAATGAAERERARETRTAARLALRSDCAAGHDWSPTGVYDDGCLCVPCRRLSCPAEMRITPGGIGAINPTGFDMQINGLALDIEDDPQGGVAKIICREIQKSYDLDSIPFADGDVVLDIGAHVGIVSIYLAKRYPMLKIYAFEPVPENFARLERNLKANGVANVTAVNQAISADGRPLTLAVGLSQNSGGSSAFLANGHAGVVVDSLTLREVFTQYGIDRVRLLKIDCEGAEHEILRTSTALLERVDYLRGEFHDSHRLRALGYQAADLIALCETVISKDHVRAHICQIADTMEGAADAPVPV